MLNTDGFRRIENVHLKSKFEHYCVYDVTLAWEVTIEPIELPQGPITRSRAKRSQDALATYVDRAWGEQVAESTDHAWTSSIGVHCSLLQAELYF
ncbi:hypothetical protein J1N35_037475 [Gossypium stocksii]|uniref:Uncharacterized protein n=1 Tax=Gossypium stocksii TaxID=47602 RepID=A0A9D3UK85_9ROSI|nr:hypothetical protein J1N35_037475 [Gossypium stocksii]